MPYRIEKAFVLQLSLRRIKMPEDPISNNEGMRVDPHRAHTLIENLGNVLQKVESVAGGRKVRFIRVRVHLPCRRKS